MQVLWCCRTQGMMHSLLICCFCDGIKDDCHCIDDCLLHHGCSRWYTSSFNNYCLSATSNEGSHRPSTCMSSWNPS